MARLQLSVTPEVRGYLKRLSEVRQQSISEIVSQYAEQEIKKLKRKQNKVKKQNMREYEVTVYFSRTFVVGAENEAEAEDKAHEEFKGSFNSIPIPDEYEVKCLEEDEE